MKYAVLSTSSSGLNNLNISHNVQIIPMHVDINNVAFLDGKNINPSTLTHIMQTTPHALAKTAPASVEEMMTIFNDLYNKGYQSVLVCTLSSKFSESYNILQHCRKLLEDKMNIYIYDTLSLNLAEGAMACEAESWLSKGKSFFEIMHRLDYIREHSAFLFTLSDLSYITRAKKLSAPASFLANLFDIKPIMEINQEGFIVPKEKVRKIDPALRRMADHILKMAGNQQPYIYLADGGYDYLTTHYSRLLYTEYGLKNLPVIPVSTISLANHGYKAMGIGAFWGELPELVERIKVSQATNKGNL